MAILGYGIWKGLGIDCGCLGPADPEADACHGLRSALGRDPVIAASIGLLVALRRSLKIEPTKIISLIKR